VASASLAATNAPAGNPLWIWNSNDGRPIQTDETRYFRKTFRLASIPSKATLSAAADDDATLYINGKEAGKSAGYDQAARLDVTRLLVKGDNVFAIKGHNVASDVAGVVALLELKTGKQKSDFVVTDESWLSAKEEEAGWNLAKFDDHAWAKVVSKGKLGDKPWGNALSVPQATAADTLAVASGFKVELLHSSEVGEGSWICMTVDSKGRLIVSPQADNQPLLRITLGKNGSSIEKIEPIPAPVHQAMGLLYAYDSLYVNGHGPNGTGLYRLIDSNKNDRFDTNEVNFLKTFAGEGEHGYHAVVLGPDKQIYVMNGNHTKVPANISPDSPHKNFQEDLMLPRQWDAGGHAVGILAPGGHVLRTDPEGRKWQIMLAGFRNAYDFDFNSEGELFTFDSDMEWDWGMPWYRPTRICQGILGAEFGWRSGTAKWPPYYPDSLPPTVNVGIGSPTGVKFGTRSHFPEPYHSALFALDWSYGRIFAVHLHPDGASYQGDLEVIVRGKPLNVTDIEFGKDGSMYFITGGRGTQSGLYRVTYTGKPPKIPRPTRIARAELQAAAHARSERRRMEAYLGKPNPKGLQYAWPYLNNPDRFLRYAARTVVEAQPVTEWKDRALAETNVNAGLESLLALARCGEKDSQKELLLALKKFPLDSLSLTQKLEKLRIIELSFTRQGKPDSDLAKLAIEKLDHVYPSDNELMNRELSQLLIFLEAPGVVGKTLALLDKARTQEEQVHYAFYLRNLKTGWTMEQRKHYLDWFKFAQEAARGEVTYPQGSPYLIWADQKKAAERHPAQLLNWFHQADREYGDGASYPKYLINIRKDVIESLSGEERVGLFNYLDDYSGLSSHKLTRERHYVQEWKMSDLEPSLPEVSHGRDFASGKAAFNDGQCILCHRFGNEGGSIGPELTAASSKYSRREILESILDPSKVISEQFQNVTIVSRDGEAETGRIMDETADKVVIQPSLLLPDRVEFKKAAIVGRKPSLVSPMPEGLLNQLTRDEILDLLAYIESMGKQKAGNFKKGTAGSEKAN
jgi:putative heme-binding domain-containing protein